MEPGTSRWARLFSSVLVSNCFITKTEFEVNYLNS